MGEFILKLTMITPKSAIQIESCILVPKFIQFSLIGILWTAGSNFGRKSENPICLGLFLYEIYFVLAVWLSKV